MATITSATSGNSNATGTWTGGVVPVSGDKVIIAHPGTNTLASTPYVLNGAASLGATTIPVTGGTGTIVAGECVQFYHSIGDDEDGLPIYDNTYYTVTTGITGNGSLVITPGLAYAMASGLRVVNRGHVVTLEASHTWGDDTSSTTAASNAIEVRGTLRASRTTSQTLTARGTIFYSTGGSIDYGVHEIDPIPVAVQAVIALNDSASLAAGKHVLTNHNNAGTTFKACGKTRTRNTRLTSATSAGATSITVDDSTGWEIGDRIVIASDTQDSSRSQIVTISGGSAPTWTVGAITFARTAGTRVGNLSSNVQFKSASANFPACIAFYSQAGTTSHNLLRLRHVRFENIGRSAGWAQSNNPLYYGSFGCQAIGGPKAVSRTCATEATGTDTSSGGGPTFYLAASNRPQSIDWAIYAGSSANAAYYGDSCAPDLRDMIAYRCGTVIFSAFGPGSDGGAVQDGEYWTTSRLLACTGNVDLTANGGVWHTVGNITLAGTGRVTINNASFDALSTGLIGLGNQIGNTGTFVFNNPTLLGVTNFDGSITSGNPPSQDQSFIAISINGVATDNRNLNYYRSAVTDLSTRKRSTYAVKIRPNVASTAITYTFKLPAVAGVAQTIKGSLRFDATYGTATPPSIVLTGQGVSQSFTAPATADAWHDFTLTFTPTSTGDITATVTVQSASTSGFAWLDGVYHYPMTQSVRHFGFQFLPQTALVADSRITVSESTALAYPVSINHATDTITLTGNATARQIFEACLADLCQTANQSEPVHITSATGDTFDTSYTVDPAGFTITGPYTDANGLHVNIRADSLLTGSRVQIYNVTDATELLNTETTGAGLVFPIIAPGTAKTIRLRVAKVGYLPIEAFGVLDGASVSFLDSQVFDTVYVANGVDGSTVTGLTPDYPNLQIDANIAGGGITVQSIYAWTRWANTDADGIRLMHNVVQAQDGANYLIDTSVVDARFDNNSATPLVISGGYIRRSDGMTVIGEGSIQLDPGRAYVAAGATAITVPAGEKVVTLAASGGFLARG